MGDNKVEIDPDQNCPYSVLPSTLSKINADKDSGALGELGGLHGLAKALCTDLNNGLVSESSGEEDKLRTVEAHLQAYGENKFPERESASLWEMLWDAAQDPMIVILLVVALVTIIIGAAVPEQRAHNGWSEGVAVMGTALIVVSIAAGQDYNKEQQFQKLNALKDIIEVKVKRDGKQILVSNMDVVVGDVMFLDTGDKLIADGVVISAQGLVIDEASLTGESDPIKKDAEHDPWVRSGTNVNEGSGYMLVVAVGVNSEWGKTMALVSQAGDDETPLQVQLTEVATQISKLGVLTAVVCFLALFIKWLVVNKGFPLNKVNENGPLQFLLYAITITVVSIPEGLPLAVTLTLAYSMKKMMNDNNFVRVLAACETMGGATAICSDKTGTLTENRMTVVEGWLAGRQWPTVPEAEQLPPGFLELLAGNSAMNSKAFLVDQPGGVTDFVGNRTECALLMLLRKLNVDYQKVRDELMPSQLRLFGFSSARKMASVLLKLPDGKVRVYNKGAAEWVLRRCASLLNEDGSHTDMDEAKQNEMLETVTAMAKRGLRCICMTYRDYEESDPTYPEGFFEDSDALDNGLICYAIVGIKDPVRKEVPAAVATCQRAGIVVRMVTGDNIHTAQHISRECGILNEGEDTVALEGPVFRTMSAQDLIPMLPRLRVLARSSPEDKLTLVSLLKKQGEVVAVTGDGTNDAPALKESDVGLAMGIAGTEVAKEAADIIILDDNFNSIVKAVLWGRCVYANIRKFLLFQLSVNLVAMISACVGALYGGVPPLNVLQLLWVNMIMDTLAALALATESPYPELLDDPPHGRYEALITNPMFVNIFAAAAYKLFWLMICLYGLPRILPRYALLSSADYYHNSCNSTMTGKGWNSTSVASLCNWMGYCGWPEGADTRDTSACSLFVGVPLSSDPRTVLCGNATASCANYDMLTTAQSQMSEEYDRKHLESYKPALSVLFNIFILAQVANAFVSRRYSYEVDFFKGVLESPIFLSIMLIITILQVIIMQTPVGFIFKVQPLDGAEWGVSIAVAVGVIIYSFLYRLAIRGMQHLAGGRSWVSLLRGNRFGGGNAGAGSMKGAGGRTASGRTMSGRMAGRMSGRLPGLRTASGQPSPRGSSSKIAPMGPSSPSTPSGAKTAWS